MFLGWFDDAKNKDAKKKLSEAIEYYLTKYGEKPTVCLVNAADAISYDGLEIKVVEYVRPNHFWVGRDDTQIVEALAA